MDIRYPAIRLADGTFGRDKEQAFHCTKTTRARMRGWRFWHRYYAAGIVVQ
jgi:hypothetical protein